MNGLAASVNTKTPHCGSRVLQCGPFVEVFISCLAWTKILRADLEVKQKRAQHRKEGGIPRWMHFACAGFIALGSHLCVLIGHAAAGEASSRSVRALAHRESNETAADENGDAKRFAERLKRHQRRHFTKQKREFRTLQARLESQRSLRKARMKARQFAAARRHAAGRASKHRQAHTTWTAHERRGHIPVDPVGNLTDGL
jgi:hypothetical protein